MRGAKSRRKGKLKYKKFLLTEEKKKIRRNENKERNTPKEIGTLKGRFKAKLIWNFEKEQK
jgi:hypothetical protein